MTEMTYYSLFADNFSACLAYRTDFYIKPIYCETQISKTNDLKVTVDVLKFASRSESQISEEQHTEICWTNYPILIYWDGEQSRHKRRVMNPKRQKRNVSPKDHLRLKLVGRIILHKQGYNTQTGG